MTPAQKERILNELNWNTEWYYKNREAGFEKAASTNWDTVKGMQKALELMGYATDFIVGIGWTITNA